MNKTTTATIDELICILTNVIRKSEAAHHLFTGSDRADQAFDDWQKMLMSVAEIAENTWNKPGDHCERALDIFENLLKAALPAANEFSVPV